MNEQAPRRGKKMPAPRFGGGELDQYLKNGWQLIPLHRPDDASVVKGKTRKDGKRPLDKRWTTEKYNSAKVAERCREEGRNAGVRLREDQLVVDVDPRNGGDESFKRLCEDLRIGCGGWPRVETGSGGSHYYLKKPGDLQVLNSTEGYPGVEFKSRGRQVVAAGSVHPDTGRRYEWDPIAPELDQAPEAPRALLDLIRRPEHTSGDQGGQYLPAEVAEMLEALDPTGFREQDRWMRLMMACHHASGGEARQEFLDWSARDPQYADEDDKGRRWDSLHADAGEARVTHRTLENFLIEAGREDAIPRTSPEEDFPDLTPEELARFGGDGGSPVDAMVRDMNRQFCAVIEGGGFKIFREDHDHAFDPPRRFFERMSRESFLHYFEDERLRSVGDRRDATVAELWLRHPKRRKYPGIVMDPEGRQGDKLNLWRGWAVKPAPGDWSMMRGLIEDVLCAGDRASGEYVVRWIAYMLQHPGRMPEVAVAFRGEEGTGKGTLGRALMRIAGTHGLTVSSPGQFAGRFNSHLRDCVFLFADEAFWPGDKVAEGILKQLVTEPWVSYEAKGKDIVPGRNMIHVMMASNKDWIVPAELKARRFFVTDVTEERRGDRAFFGRLGEQLDRGGLAGMVHDLLSLDLAGWHPANDLPHTAALADQKEQTMEPPMRFWLGLLRDGLLPHRRGGEKGYAEDHIEMCAWQWEGEGPVTLGGLQRRRMVEEYRDFLTRGPHRYHNATPNALVKAGKKAFGLISDQRKSGGGERVWVLPPLNEARARFEKCLGAKGLFDEYS